MVATRTVWLIGTVWGSLLVATAVGRFVVLLQAEIAPILMFLDFVGDLVMLVILLVWAAFGVTDWLSFNGWIATHLAYTLVQLPVIAGWLGADPLEMAELSGLVALHLLAIVLMMILFNHKLPSQTNDGYGPGLISAEISASILWEPIRCHCRFPGELDTIGAFRFICHKSDDSCCFVDYHLDCLARELLAEPDLCPGCKQPNLSTVRFEPSIRGLINRPLMAIVTVWVIGTEIAGYYVSLNSGYYVILLFWFATPRAVMHFWPFGESVLTLMYRVSWEGYFVISKAKRRYHELKRPFDSRLETLGDRLPIGEPNLLVWSITGAIPILSLGLTWYTTLTARVTGFSGAEYIPLLLLPAVVGVILLGLVMLLNHAIVQIRYCCEPKVENDEDEEQKTVQPEYHQPVKPDEIEMVVT